MKTVYARYRVKRNRKGQCLEALEEFVDAIRENEPQVFVYDAFVEEDGVTFVHIMRFANEEAEKAHRKAAHTKKFVSALHPNCEEEPAFHVLKPVASNK